MKYTYITLVVVIGLAASIFIYNYSSSSSGDVSEAPQKVSSKVAKGIASCKNTRLEIDGKVFQLKNGAAQAGVNGSNSPDNALLYNNHAARGVMDSGPVEDMVCAYSLNDGSDSLKTYIGILIGQTGDLYISFGSILLGEDIDITDMQIVNGKANIAFRDNLSKKTSTKTIYLDGDEISVLEN